MSPTPLSDNCGKTDAQLVTEFQETGDRQVFAVLYTRYFDKVKLYCHKSLGDQQRALDAAQDIFLQVFEKLPTLRNPQLWVAWLFKIARNKVLNLHHIQARRQADSFECARSLYEENPDEETRREYDCKLDALPNLLAKDPSCRILQLKYVEGHSIEQLCQELHMGESAVKMRLLRARQNVISMYEQQYAKA